MTTTTPTQRAILEVLQRKDSTATEIANKIGHARISVATKLARLQASQQIHVLKYVLGAPMGKRLDRAIPVYRIGKGASAPVPDEDWIAAEQDRLADAELAARPRPTPARDPVVAALFGPYRGRANRGASAP